MTEYETFCQIWCEYDSEFSTFKANIVPKIRTAKCSMASSLEEHGEDFLCASCMPWLHFTSITQVDYSFDQIVSILAWGKMSKDYLVPISCKFNYRLMDGLHVSRFLIKLNNFLAIQSFDICCLLRDNYFF